MSNKKDYKARTKWNFELVKLGPSAFNLQQTNYITVLGSGMKKRLQQAAEIYKGLKLLGIANKHENDVMAHYIVSFFQSRGEEFQKKMQLEMLYYQPGSLSW